MYKTDFSTVVYSFDYFQSKDVCRLCWNKCAQQDVPKSEILLDQKQSSENIHWKIIYCLQIDPYEVYDMPLSPPKLCNTCFENISKFFEFKLFCNTAYEKLKEIIQNEITKQAALTYEVKIENYDEFVKNEPSESNFESELLAEPLKVISKKTLKPNSLKPKLSKYRRKKDSTNYCNTCHEDIDPNSLDEHNKIIHAYENGQYKCHGCNKEFSLRRSRLQHELLTCKEMANGYKCAICNKILPKRRIYEIHVKNHSLPPNKVKEESLVTVKIPRVRKIYQKNDNYCRICHRLIEPTLMTEHNKTLHGIDNGLYLCFGCGKSFKCRSSRLTHEQLSCKELVNGYKCTICDRFLPKRRTYESHMKNHRENRSVELPDKLFKCSRCAVTFETKIDLSEHEEKHKTLKHYVCEICGRVFTKQDYLNKHVATHTGAKRYFCPHCDYGTPQKSALNVHVRIHTGERPYQCDLCPQRCVNASNLRAHKATHQGIKDYECSFCSKRFGYKISLEEHIASIHEKITPYECAECGIFYWKLRLLKAHIRAKHAGDGDNSTKRLKRTAQSTVNVDKRIESI